MLATLKKKLWKRLLKKYTINWNSYRSFEIFLKSLLCSRCLINLNHLYNYLMKTMHIFIFKDNDDKSSLFLMDDNFRISLHKQPELFISFMFSDTLSSFLFVFIAMLVIPVYFSPCSSFLFIFNNAGHSCSSFAMLVIPVYF